MKKSTTYMAAVLTLFTVIFLCQSSGHAASANTESNKRSAQNYCTQQNDKGIPCKISPTPGCGPYWTKVKKFRNGGNAWYACKKHTPYKDSTRKNKEECFEFCADRGSECSCLQGDGCGGRQGIVLKRFIGIGQNVTACEKRVSRDQASVENKQACLDYCIENDCTCSRKRGCGKGYKAIKRWTGKGDNWHACVRRESRSQAPGRNKQACEAWCNNNQQCARCSNKFGCGNGYKRIMSFKGPGDNFYACEKR